MQPLSQSFHHVQHRRLACLPAQFTLGSARMAIGGRCSSAECLHATHHHAHAVGAGRCMGAFRQISAPESYQISGLPLGGLESLGAILGALCCCMDRGAVGARRCWGAPTVAETARKAALPSIRESRTCSTRRSSTQFCITGAAGASERWSAVLFCIMTSSCRRFVRNTWRSGALAPLGGSM